MCWRKGIICSIISSVQSLSRVWLFMTPRTTAHQASLSITNSRSLLKFISIELVMPSNHLVLCCPLLPPAFNLSQHQGLFQWVSSSHQVQCIGASARALSPANDYSGLISFRINWFDLPASLWGPKSHSAKIPSILCLLLLLSHFSRVRLCATP